MSARSFAFAPFACLVTCLLFAACDTPSQTQEAPGPGQSSSREIDYDPNAPKEAIIGMWGGAFQGANTIYMFEGDGSGYCVSYSNHQPQSYDGKKIPLAWSHEGNGLWVARSEGKVPAWFRLSPPREGEGRILYHIPDDVSKLPWEFMRMPGA